MPGQKCLLLCKLNLVLDPVGARSASGISKLWSPETQSSTLSVFVFWFCFLFFCFGNNPAYLFLCCLRLFPCYNGRVVITETVQPVIWPFIENICQPLPYSYLLGPHLRSPVEFHTCQVCYVSLPVGILWLRICTRPSVQLEKCQGIDVPGPPPPQEG